MNEIKLKVIYVPYRRYEDAAPNIGHITASSFREAIVKMLTKVRMYADKVTIEEYEKELGRQMTQNELVDMLYAENGDGCDFIVALTNETTGESYMAATEFGFEEWTI